jgi:hypothetical protein
MNAEINSFLWRLAKRDILTPGQCLVLRELFDEKSTIQDCVLFVEKNKLLPDAKFTAMRLAAESGARQITVEEMDLDENIEFLLDEKKPIDRSRWHPDMGLEWFCFLSVKKGFMSRGTCLSIIADLDEATDVLGFAQAVIDCGLSKDLEKVQELVDEALEMWARGKPPPYSILAGGDWADWEKQLEQQT